MYSSYESTEVYEQKQTVCKSFVDHVKDYTTAVILVGSLVWKEKTLINLESDIDVVLVVRPDRLHALLDQQPFDTLFEPVLVRDILDKGHADYLVAKFEFLGEDFSADIILEPYFEKLCSIPLRDQQTTLKSSKFGHSPQTNTYPILSLAGDCKTVSKQCQPYSEGYIIELPLFHILHERYYYGIPTVKLLTSEILYAQNHETERLVETLFEQVSLRAVHESRQDGRPRTLTNLFYRRELMDEAYLRAVRAKELEISEKLMNKE